MFYKLLQNELIEAKMVFLPNSVELRPELKDTYSYPIDGWYWFESEVSAKEFFDIEEFEDSYSDKVIIPRHPRRSRIVKIRQACKPLTPPSLNNAELDALILTIYEELVRDRKDDHSFIQEYDRRKRYDRHEVVKYEGNYYKSLRENNSAPIDEISLRFWKKIEDEPSSPSKRVSAWIKPESKRLGYSIGDRVTFDGFTWESNAHKNDIEPGVGRAWKKVV